MACSKVVGGQYKKANAKGPVDIWCNKDKACREGVVGAWRDHLAVKSNSKNVVKTVVKIIKRNLKAAGKAKLAAIKARQAHAKKEVKVVKHAIRKVKKVVKSVSSKEAK